MAGEQVAQLYRPSCIVIHARDEKATILYISSGIRQCAGYQPEDMISKPGEIFIADTSNTDYPIIFADKPTDSEESNNGDDATDNEANAYVMYVNARSRSGAPVFHRITSFKADSCVVCVGVAFPEVPFVDRRELEVKMLDKAMQSLNVTRERETRIEKQRSEVAKRGGQGAMFCAPSKRIKAVMVLEHPVIADIEIEQSGRRPNGPLVAFCTASIEKLIDADNTDLQNYPFLKLVAPEDVVHVCKFFDLMSESTDVLFEKFSLLQRPHILEGDIFVADEENPRVVVECMGAAVNDGVAVLMRKLHVEPAPKKDKLGNYIRLARGDDSDKDEMSLFDLLSTEPETSDAPDGWSQLR